MLRASSYHPFIILYHIGGLIMSPYHQILILYHIITSSYYYTLSDSYITLISHIPVTLCSWPVSYVCWPPCLGEASLVVACPPGVWRWRRGACSHPPVWCWVGRSVGQWGAARWGGIWRGVSGRNGAGRHPCPRHEAGDSFWPHAQTNPQTLQAEKWKKQDEPPGNLYQTFHI